MKTIKYPAGCAMTLYVPLVVLSNTSKSAAVANKFTNLSASVSLHGEKTAIVPVIVDSFMTLFLPATLKAGQYVIEYSFKYDGMPCRGSWAGKLELVTDNGQSNWAGFISDGIATLDDQIFIAGNMMTDAELEALKLQYTASIAAANASKAAYDTAKAQADAAAYNAANTLTEEGIKEAVEEPVSGGISVEADLTPVTSRLDSTTYGLQAIKTAVDSIEVDVPEGIAMESNATANKEAIIAAMPSTSGLALETTAQAAKDAADAAKTAAENITIPSDVARKTDIPTDYAKAADIPSVSDIQSGLAKTTDIPAVPTDYAKASDVPSVESIQSGLATSSAVSTIDGKLASRNASNEPVNVGVAVGGVALSLGEDADSQPLHDKVDTIGTKIGETTDTESASSVFGKLANISQELGNLTNIFSGISAQDITDELNAETEA